MQTQHQDKWEKVDYVGSEVNIKASVLYFSTDSGGLTDAPIGLAGPTDKISTVVLHPQVLFPPLPTIPWCQPHPLPRLFQRLIPPHPFAPTGKSLEDGAPSAMIFCSAWQWKVHTYSVCPPLSGSIPGLSVNLIKHTSMHLVKDLKPR